VVVGTEPGLKGRAVPHTFKGVGAATDLDVGLCLWPAAQQQPFQRLAEHPTQNLNVQGHIQDIDIDMLMSVDVCVALC